MCDVLQPATLDKLPSVDTVLYAVGFDRTAGVSMRSVYVDGLANVLGKLPPPGKFIYISSSSVYGQTGGEWVDEESATAPEEEAGQIVRAAEMVLEATMPDAIVLRFAGIYGPGRLLRQKALAAGEPLLADPDRWLNLIHVDDGARAALAAEQHARPGRIYNVCDDHPVQRHDVLRRPGEGTGRAAPRFVAPPAGMPAPPHEKGNRRLRNQRLREELQFVHAYKSYAEGLRAACHG